MCVGVVALANIPIVTGHYFLTYDSVMAFYPWHHYLRHQPAFGIGAWIPLAGCGFPGGSNGQMGFFFPLNIPFYLPVSTLSAMILSTLLCLIIAALGAYLLVRSYGVDRVPAVAGAVVFATMGAMLAHVDHLSMIGAAAFIPYVCYAARMAATRSVVRWGAVAGAMVGLQFLAAYPQIAGMGVITATLMLGAELWLVHRTSPQRLVGKCAAFLLICCIIGLGIGAVQAWPMMELSDHSVRDTAGGYEFCTAYSLPLAHLTRFVIPNLFGANDATYHGLWNHQELHPYVGLVPLMLVVWLLMRARNHTVKALVLVCCTALLLALGGSTPLYRILCHVPYFGTFRCPARWLFVTSLLLGVLAAMALGRLADSGYSADVKKLSKWMLWSAGVLMLLYVSALAATPVASQAIEKLVEAGRLPMPSAVGDGDISAGVAAAYRARVIAPVSTFPYAAGALLLAGIGLFGMNARRWGSGVCFGLVLAGMTLESGLMMSAYDPYESADLFEERPVVTASLPVFPASGRYYYEQDADILSSRQAVDAVAHANPSIADYFVPRENLNVAHGLASYRIYDPLELANQANLRRLLEPYLYKPQVAAMVGVEYAVVSEKRAAKFEGWELMSVVEGMAVLRNPAYVGLAYIAHGTADVGCLADDAANEVSGAPNSRLLNVAYGQNLLPTENLAVASTASEHVEVERWDSRGISLVAESAQAGYLIVTNNAYPGWKATVDGAPMEISTVNTAFMGIALSAGRHVVEMNYSTPRLHTGVCVTGLALLLCAGFVVLGGKRRPDDAMNKSANTNHHLP